MEKILFKKGDKVQVIKNSQNGHRVGTIGEIVTLGDYYSVQVISNDLKFWHSFKYLELVQESVSEFSIFN